MRKVAKISVDKRRHFLECPALLERLLALDNLVRKEGEPSIIELLNEPATPKPYLLLLQRRDERRAAIAEAAARYLVFNPATEAKSLERITTYLKAILPPEFGRKTKSSEVAQAMTNPYYSQPAGGYLVDFVR